MFTTLLIDLIVALAKGFALPLSEDLLGGKITRPTKTLVEAQADPDDVDAALDYVTGYEDANP